MSNNKYEPYSSSELKTLLQEPWEISDQPYKLHAAFALSCLFDTFEPENDNNELDQYKNFWGWSLPKKIVDRLIQEIATDFNDAADNRKQIKIWGRGYSIRKVNAYDHNRLTEIFRFPVENEEYVITQDGIMNLAGSASSQLENYEVSKDQFKANRNYLRQIIMLAEDDANNGWDKLTDIEVLIYCWAAFYNKHQVDNLKQFLQEYKDYIYVSQSDIQECLNEKSSLREKPIGMYAFSRDRTMQWNKDNGQKSYADTISPEEADKYWYDVALKNSFKPIDFN